MPELRRRELLVLFAQDKYEISQQSSYAINALAKEIESKLNSGQYYIPPITINGYASSEGGMLYNKKLSLQRAIAVKQALVKDGVPAELLNVVGNGESFPVTNADGSENESKSRRVHFYVEFKPLIARYEPCREGIANLENMRRVTVDDKLGVSDEIQNSVAKGFSQKLLPCLNLLKAVVRRF